MAVKTDSEIANSMKQQLQASASHFWSSMKSLEQTMKKPIVMADGETTVDEEGGQVSLESVIRVMFGSCTTGIVTRTEEEEYKTEAVPESPSRSRGRSKSTCEPASPPAKEDRRYAQLFSDTLRAEEAVYHLREQLEHRKAERSPSRKKKNKVVPGFYPASSPNKAQREISIPALPNITEVADKADVNQCGHHHFDDDISCISQQTLEDLAEACQAQNGRLERVHSDITQEPADTAEESWKKTLRPRVGASPRRNRLAALSPFIVSRGRSYGTHNTRQSTGRSLATKSTLSTQTNDFAAAWQKDEQRYWDGVVKEEDETSPTGTSPSRRDRLRSAQKMLRRGTLKRDGTVTTVHSSVNTLPSSQMSAVEHDPNGFMEVLEMPPGTEIGEI